MGADDFKAAGLAEGGGFERLPRVDVAHQLERHGDEFMLRWPKYRVKCTVSHLRGHSDGLAAELTVLHAGVEIHWGRLALASTQARQGVVRKVNEIVPKKVPWRTIIEVACREPVKALRASDKFVTLTGKVHSPARELLPRLLYEGEPTLLYGDGDTGKSLTATAVAVAVQAGLALPFGLKPAQAVPVAILDWETSQDTVETRLALLAAGFGIVPPPILYRQMTRPLIEEASTLAAEFSRRGIRLVIIDSKMFAVAGIDGAFHEPITGFYSALRLFTPAASLVLNHVTNDVARGQGRARPFGGAFAFNGPRLIWEAKRDLEIEDATAIAFTCTKANNLPRKPEPFGLRFIPSDGAITVAPLDLREAAPSAVTSASVPYRIRLALKSGGDMTAAEVAEHLQISEDDTGRNLRRLREKKIVTQIADTKPIRWRLAR
jgi:hypothetical protein